MRFIETFKTCPYCANEPCPGLGFCHCGCGQRTKISNHTVVGKHPEFKSHPRRFIFGHQRTMRPSIEEAKPFKIDGVYCRLIELTQGQFTIVWESDYAFLMERKWFAKRTKGPSMFHYAMSRRHVSDGCKGAILMHRVLLGFGPGDGRIGDHINGNTLDNRRSNLREVLPIGNAQNAKRRSDNTSGYKGVCWNKEDGRWAARIQVDGKRVFLGYFTDKASAAEAYRSAATQMHGEFARLL